ncbi:MAG: OmpA family protein [Bacteroidota bacterium]
MKYSLIFCCLLLSGQLIAQDHILFHDDFTLDAYRWAFGERSNSSARLLPNGQLALSHQAVEGSFLFTHELYLNRQKNFSLYALLTQTPAGINNSHGICWSVNEAEDSYYAFLIRPEGYFKIIKVIDGAETELCPWTRNRRIRRPGEANELLIEKQGWRLFFFVNDREVHSLKMPKQLGKRLGFVLNQQVELVIDELTVRHPPIDIPLVEGPILNARKAPLDSNINHPDLHDTAPILSRNGRQLYYTRSDSSQWLKAGDIWETHVQGDTMWAPARLLPAPLNNQDRNSVVYLYPRASQMLLGSSYHPNGQGRGQGIAESRQLNSEENIWDTPSPIAIPRFMSTTAPTTWNLSHDHRVLIFSAQASGGYGESDLYVSLKGKNGWTAPKNMGPSINTYASEMTPYLDKDNETLYFSSNGHPGYGAGDVYVSQRLSNTWTQWSQPLNLGSRINGPTWDAWYTPLPERPRRAFMATVDTVHGTYDLYGVRIPLDISKQPIVRVYGRVLNRKTNVSLGAQVHSLDLSPDSLVKDTEAADPVGTYSMYLPFGKAYQIFPERIGYYSVIDTLDVRPVKQFREIQKDLYLAPIEIGETIKLERVYFYRATANLIETSFPELNRLVYLMQAIPTLEIDIRGHTDNIGSATELRRLSEQRAEVVRQYLIQHGISARRITGQGFGPTVPVASNAHPETRRLNRRVEFYIKRR